MGEFGPLVLIDTAGCDFEEDETEETEDSKRNKGEAKIALQHCQNLLKSGLNIKDIGIITPYSAQVIHLSFEGNFYQALYCTLAWSNCVAYMQK